MQIDLLLIIIRKDKYIQEYISGYNQNLSILTFYNIINKIKTKFGYNYFFNKPVLHFYYRY